MNFQEIVEFLVRYLETFLHVHLLLALMIYVFILISQRKHFKHLKIKTYTKDSIPFAQIHAPYVSIIVPMHNEGCRVIDSIDAALSAEYPNLEVIVVNDGSIDDCFEKVVAHFQMTLSFRERFSNLGTTEPSSIFLSTKDPRLTLINKTHTGKADTLNTGIDFAIGVLVTCMDGDSLMLPDALPKLVTKFINEPALIAVGGSVAPSNQLSIRNGVIVRQETRSTFLERLQVVEYLRSFTLWRTGWSYLDGLLIISGAMTVFSRAAIVKIDGFCSDTVTEDLDTILRLHQYYAKQQTPYHIWTVPDVICWTRTPTSIASLRKQRIRWMVGALQCLSKNRQLIGNSQNRVLGWLALPHLIFIEIFAPVIEFLGILALLASGLVGILSYESLFIYGFLIYALTGFYSWNAIYAGDIYFKNYSSLKDDLRVGLVGLLEPIGYRQLDSIWRMVGWWYWLRGKKVSW